MRLARRAMLGMLATIPVARAQPPWPQRPLRIIIPYAPGGPTDLIGRVVAARAQASLGQPLVIENRPGASGVIGAAEVARAAPDGATFLMNASIHVIIPHLNPTMPYDALADFAPVTNMASVPLVALVNPALPVRSLAELAAHLRANPGRLAFASSGNGAAQHLAGALFQQLTGTTMTHVPYRGAGPAIQDLIAGTVQVMFDSIPASAGAVREGLLRPLAVTVPRRLALYPDLPTAAEAGFPGLEIATWYGIWAPARTPAPILERFREAVAEAVASPETRARLASLGAEPVADTPAAFAAFCAREHERFGALVRAARITLD